ncbi:MAG: hypothetical protein WKG06_42965 [Segetibacter sp.]
MYLTLQLNSNVFISALKITGGNASSTTDTDAKGGGINNQGVLTLTGVAVTGNSSRLEGGAINNTNGLILRNVEISGSSSQELLAVGFLMVALHHLKMLPSAETLL